jgi:hypothetical protein
MQAWPKTVDNQERTRRLIDLFLVSVLLDAGAGTKWQYRSKESGKVYRRSEGLAVASLEMFKAGLFSSSAEQPFQVDSAGLRKLDITAMARGLQVTEENPLDGLQGRTNLLLKLADALQNQEVFGLDARPGNILGKSSFCDYTTEHVLTTKRLSAVTPFHTSIFSAHYSPAYFLEHSHGYPDSNLALAHAD